MLRGARLPAQGERLSGIEIAGARHQLYAPEGQAPPPIEAGKLERERGPAFIVLREADF